MLNTYIQNYSNAEIQIHKYSDANYKLQIREVEWTGDNIQAKYSQIHNISSLSLSNQMSDIFSRLQIFNVFGKQVGYPQMSEILSGDKS